MLLLDLAKELGLPYERLIHWCRKVGYGFKSPVEELSPADVVRIREIYSKTAPADESEKWDEDQFEAVMEDVDLDLEGLPQNLEELESIEKTLLGLTQKKEKSRVAKDRIPLQKILRDYGLSGKTALKKVRKELPEDIARLFNHQSLTEEQAAVLNQALAEKISLCCDHPTCRYLLTERHGKDNLISTSNQIHCRLCKGSTSRRSMEELAGHCVKAGVKHILVLGGAPASHKELNQLTPSSLEFRLIAGDIARDKQRAFADLNWCDLVVLWAGTILDHSVSNQYLKGGKTGSLPVVVAKRRSVEALCAAVITTVKTQDPFNGKK
ncbi:MAG: hypothetical protein KJ645_09980 [Planctomycetes bacterium]|nr:hypothetical protein [Planctomycetota bacterium]